MGYELEFESSTSSLVLFGLSGVKWKWFVVVILIFIYFIYSY